MATEILDIGDDKFEQLLISDQKARSDLFPQVQFHSEKEVVEGSDDEGTSPPSHPILSMQAPFEESIAESTTTDGLNSVFPAKYTPKQRHQRLLDGREFNDSYNARWRKCPKQSYHPLWKIAAQIIFGVHLLQQQLAKSDEEVVRILQRHVDEVDSFIQRSGEDFETTLADVRERINYLELPLQHAAVFDQMLEDKQFRVQIVTGNELIEGVIARTAELLNDYLIDIAKGKEVTKEMSDYLLNVERQWPDGDASSSFEIYKTMQANSDGWLECFQGLQMKANRLGAALVQLGNILNEMQARVGVASRRVVSRSQSRQGSRPGSSQSQRRKVDSAASYRTPASRYARSLQQKPLPEDPDEQPATMKTIRSTYAKANGQRARTPISEGRHKPWSPGEEPHPQELPTEYSSDSPKASRRPAMSRRITSDDGEREDGPPSALSEFGFTAQARSGSRTGTASRQSSKRSKTRKDESALGRSTSATGRNKTPVEQARSVKSERGTRTKLETPLMFDSAYSSGSSDQVRKISPTAVHPRPSTAPDRDTSTIRPPSQAEKQNLVRSPKLAQLTGGFEANPLPASYSRRTSVASTPAHGRPEPLWTGVPTLVRRGSASDRPGKTLKRKPSFGSFSMFKKFFSFKWMGNKGKKRGLGVIYELDGEKGGNGNGLI